MSVLPSSGGMFSVWAKAILALNVSSPSFVFSSWTYTLILPRVIPPTYPGFPVFSL